MTRSAMAILLAVKDLCGTGHITTAVEKLAVEPYTIARKHLTVHLQSVYSAKLL